MAIVAKDSGGSFEKPPAGVHLARCIRVIDLGTQINERFGKEQRKVRLYWELPSVLKGDGEYAGQPFVITKQYTLSLGEKANLRQDLRSWRGRDFGGQELSGFDLSNVLDKCCMVNIVHDDDYANIAAIMPVPKGTEAPPRVNDLLVFDLDNFDETVFNGLTERVQETIKRSKEWRSRSQAGTSSRVQATSLGRPADDDFDDDIPW